MYETLGVNPWIGIWIEAGIKILINIFQFGRNEGLHRISDEILVEMGPSWD